jgi:hypothetical protein
MVQQERVQTLQEYFEVRRIVIALGNATAHYKSEEEEEEEEVVVVVVEEEEDKEEDKEEDE